MQGTVQSIEQDIVTIAPVGVNFDRQKVQIPVRSVRKHFKPGDHGYVPRFYALRCIDTNCGS